MVTYALLYVQAVGGKLIRHPTGNTYMHCQRRTRAQKPLKQCQRDWVTSAWQVGWCFLWTIRGGTVQRNNLGLRAPGHSLPERGSIGPSRLSRGLFFSRPSQSFHIMVVPYWVNNRRAPGGEGLLTIVLCAGEVPSLWVHSFHSFCPDRVFSSFFQPQQAGKASVLIPYLR